jgi:hypothetical protein
MQVLTVARPETVTWAKELRVAQDHGSGQVPVAKQCLRPVEIGQDGIQQAGALDQSLLQHAPFVRADQHRHEIQVPGPIRVMRCRVRRVGQTILVQQPFGEAQVLREFAVRHAFEAVEEPCPVGPD